MAPRPSPAAVTTKPDPSTPSGSPDNDAPQTEERAFALAAVAPLPEEPAPPVAAPGSPSAVDPVARLEAMLGRFMSRVDERLSDVERRAQTAAPAEDETPVEDRVRPDEYLAEMAADVSVKELYRMLELKGGADDLARYKAAGVSPDTHMIATDCMAIGILDADGKEVQTKVAHGDPIPLNRLTKATIEWGLRHPEGPKFARPGEYRAPKATPAHTR